VREHEGSAVRWRVWSLAALVAACGNGDGERSDRGESTAAKIVPAERAPAATPPAPGASPDPALARRRNLEGDRLVREGRLDEAIRAYERALVDDPGHARAASNLAWTRFLAGDLDGAERDGERALALAGDDAALAGAAHYNLGRVAEQRGDLEGAKRRYRDSLRVRPHAGVAARLAGLETDAERDEDAELFASSNPPPPERKVVRAGSLTEALAQCAIREPQVIDDGFALARSSADGHLVAVMRLAPRSYGSLVLGPGARPRVTAGLQPGERIVVGDRVWFLRAAPDGIQVSLELAPGYSWRAVDRDLVVTPDEDTPADPEGPEGRWRLVEGVYRKLQL
jgi:hypothetical protein